VAVESTAGAIGFRFRIDVQDNSRHLAPVSPRPAPARRKSRQRCGYCNRLQLGRWPKRVGKLAANISVVAGLALPNVKQIHFY